MVEEERRKLTWEDATQRFLDVAALTAEERASPVERGFDRAAWMLHNSLCGACVDRQPSWALPTTGASDSVQQGACRQQSDNGKKFICVMACIKHQAKRCGILHRPLSPCCSILNTESLIMRHPQEWSRCA